MEEEAKEVPPATVEQEEAAVEANHSSPSDDASNPPSEQHEMVRAVRELVLHDVEDQVAKKFQELLQRGQKMLATFQEKQKERTTRLMDEVAKCYESQRAMEAENLRLRSVIEGMLARLPPAPPGALAAMAGQGPATPEAASQRPSAPPGAPLPRGSGGDAVGATVTKLPEVPAFPFPGLSPGASPPAAPPLLLADALGGGGAPAASATGQRTPLSLANSVLPSPEGPSPFGTRGKVHPAIFQFALRKADGADLGVNVSHHENDRVLRVESVRPGGAVEAWNRLCSSSAMAAEKSVLPGDQIISVNGVKCDPERMLEECRSKQLLRLTIIRAEWLVPPIPNKGALPASSTMTSLRADASVFVPMSAEASAGAVTEEESVPGPNETDNVSSIMDPQEKGAC